MEVLIGFSMLLLLMLVSVLLGLGICVATFWERASHSAYHMFFLLCLFVVLVVSNFGFVGGDLVLIAPVPDNCLRFPFHHQDVTKK